MHHIPQSVIQYTGKSISTIHHILRPPRRRLIIGLVAHRVTTSDSTEFGQLSVTESFESRPAVTVRRLTREIVAIEQNIPIDQATGDAYHNVYSALIQFHLPELDDVGAVRYDADRKKVVPGQNLLALSTVAAISSPVARMLFHNSVADLYVSGASSIPDAINDE